MSFWQHLRQFFGRKPSQTNASVMSHPPHLEDDAPEVVVPEMSAAELTIALTAAPPPLVIDIREPYEWRLVRLSGARHIPMNDVPAQLDTLPRDQPIVVMCSHGSRSYSVAAWLIEQGFDASSLAGGITQWAQQGGAVEQGAP